MNQSIGATYRLNFNPTFRLQDGCGLVKYLHKLGITHIYTSPLFKAKEGSFHGYDVVDPTMIEPTIGTMDDLLCLSDLLKQKGMGIVLDIVPNHMAYTGDNPYLMDIFENGPASRYYHFFDIEWNHPYEDLNGRVLAPFLGSPFSEALVRGEIGLGFDRQGFYIHYYELRFPLKVETYEMVLTHRLHTLREAISDEHPDYIKFLGVLYSLKSLPENQQEAPQREAQVGFIKRLLWELYSGSPFVREFIDENIRIFNGQKGDPESFKYLEALLEEQVYRLSYWKVATEEINYRRFFNINSLICVRQEDERVFHYYHSLIRDLCQRGIVDGLRVDHLDGLYEPTGYLHRLRKETGAGYIVVEKILEPREVIPGFWPVEGTTGYDALHWINQVFVMGKNRRAFDRVYRSFSALKVPYEELFYEKKKMVLEKEMMGDMDNMARMLKGLATRMRYGKDFTIYGLKEALMEFFACLPVYRTYIDEQRYRPYDRLVIKRTIQKAKERNPGLIHELDFLFKVLSLSEQIRLAAEDIYPFIKRLQQFTGPLMAKGFEDTLLYVYNRLLSLNEVGSDPEVFGVSLREFHLFMKKRATSWPLSMTTTSTHDTKRGEDVRARLNVLSEMPRVWEKYLMRWKKRNERYKGTLNGIKAPEANDEYLFYQTLLGSLPFEGEPDGTYIQRIKDFMIKAMREAKVHTSWVNPNLSYEEAVLRFIDAIFSDRVFMKSLLRFKDIVAFYGMLNSLSQVLLKCTVPGVVDIYQGTELWDLNLVDPDNRRPVNFALRKGLLDEVSRRDGPGFLRELIKTYPDGRIKLYILYKALQARKKRPELFVKGEYIALSAKGPRAEHVVAFARRSNEQWAITVVGRFFSHLSRPGVLPTGRKFWGDTYIRLPEGIGGLFVDELTGQSVRLSSKKLPLAHIFKTIPQCLLVKG